MKTMESWLLNDNMLIKLIDELGKVWYILVALMTIAWFLSQANDNIIALQKSDEKQDLRIEAINSDITSIKIDTSYIRARIDGQIPPQRK